MNKDQMIYDLLKEVREEQRHQRHDIDHIKTTMHVNTMSLQEHMRRSDALETIAQEHKSRIEALEAPAKIDEAITKQQEEKLKKAELKSKRLMMIFGTASAILTLLAALVKLGLF